MGSWVDSFIFYKSNYHEFLLATPFKIYSVGLDTDHLDAPFSEKLQRAFVHFENLDLSERIKLGGATKKWIGLGFESLSLLRVKNYDYYFFFETELKKSTFQLLRPSSQKKKVR